MTQAGIKIRSSAIFIALLCVVPGIEIAVAQSVQSQKSHLALIQHWRTMVSTNVAAFLVEMDENDLSSQWPRIRSSASIAGMADGEEKALALEENKLGREVLEALMAYPERLPEVISPGAEFRTHRALITFRNVLLDKLCYVNLLLADTVNTVLFVDLTRRVVLSDGTAIPTMNNVLDALQDYALDLDALEEIVVGPSGQSLDGVKDVELPSFRRDPLRPSRNIDEQVELRIRRFYRLLIMASGGSTIEDAFTGMHSGDRYQLFDKRDTLSLLMLYRITDARIYRELPYLIESYVAHGQRSQGQPKGAMLREKGTSISWPTGGKAGTAQRLQRLVRANQLDGNVGLEPAQKAMAKTSSSGGDVDVQGVLRDIKGIKAQLRMTKALKNGSEVSKEEIEKYLRKKLPVPEGGGEYVVGSVGEAPVFVRPNGDVVVLRE